MQPPWPKWPKGSQIYGAEDLCPHQVRGISQVPPGTIFPLGAGSSVRVIHLKEETVGWIVDSLLGLVLGIFSLWRLYQV